MKSLPRSVTRGLIHVLCAFVLLAQQAALTHVVSHAAAATQQHDAGASGSERAPAPALAGLCAYDAAFWQVLGSAPTSHHAALTGTAASQAVLHRARACTTADALTPRSRGPPLLL